MLKAAFLLALFVVAKAGEMWLQERNFRVGGRNPQVDVCALPKDSGWCYGYNPMYYYNSTTRVCEYFIYRGCSGNENRFGTFEECYAKCGGRIAEVDVCELPSDMGPCRAKMPMYFFNSNSGECEPFIYGGCAGNANRFWTEQECYARCPVTVE